MSELLSDTALDQLFRQARTYNAFQDLPVSDELLRRVYELAKFGPTSANSSPARIVFVKSAEAKARLEPFLSEGNRRLHEHASARAVTALVTPAAVPSAATRCVPPLRRFS